jgi:predicted secreted protein
MSKINGKDIVLKLSTDGITYKSLICEISNDLSLDTQTTDVLTKCSDLAYVSVGATSGEITFDAVADSDVTGSQVSINQIISWMVAKTTLYFKIEYPTGGAQLSRTGQGIITKYKENHTVQDLVQFSGTLKINGSLVTLP